MATARGGTGAWKRWTLVSLTVAALVFGAGWLGLWASLRADVLTSVRLVWPATALALVAAMRFGLGVLPAVAAGDLLLVLQGHLRWVDGLSMAVGDVAAVALAVAILRRLDRGLTPLDRVGSFAAFVLVGGFLQSLVNTLVAFGLDAFLQGLSFPWKLFLDNLGLDAAMGTIVFAPILMVPWAARRRPEDEGSLTELAALLAYAVSACYVAFFMTLESEMWDRVLPFFVYPAVLWGAIRFGHRGVGVVLLLTYVLAVWGILARTGAFATNPVASGVTAMHVFMGLAAAAGFAISTALDERWRAQAALRENERLYRYLVETSSDIIWSLDSQGRFTFVNEAIRRTHGYEPTELIGRPFTDFVFETAQRDRDLETFQRVKGGQPHFHYETVHRKRDGSPVYLSVNAVVVTDEEGSSIGATGTATDITERVKAHAELQASEARFRSIFEFSPLGICIGRDGKPLYVNGAFARMFGYSSADEILALPVAQLVPAEVRARVEKRLRSQDPGNPLDKSYELLGLRKDSTTFPLSIAVEWIPLPEGPAVVGFVTDLTDRQSLEAQLRHSQKMEAVGRLAGGVAHDFNNLLTVILGYCDLLRTGAATAESRKGLTEITLAGQRAAALTQQLLAFSRRQVLNMEPLDLNARVLATVDLLRRLIGEDVGLATDLRANPAVIRADPTQIDQILLNLAVNARDAMPRGGTLTLSTRYADLDADDVKFQGTLPAGGYVVLSVRDTGEGMDEATKSHVFEPFFTTKENGRGTGLGLAMVYGIVQQSGGHIGVETERGKGACFEIHFPSHGGPAAAPSRETAAPSVKGTSARGAAAARILLVEDEELVRGFAKSALETQGYSVVEAASGRAALDHVRANPRSIDMVLTDVVMPQMGGVELAGELAALEPGVKILYMSGYAEGRDAGAGRLDGGSLLAKPFSPRQLLEKVQAVLDG